MTKALTTSGSRVLLWLRMAGALPLSIFPIDRRKSQRYSAANPSLKCSGPTLCYQHKNRPLTVHLHRKGRKSCLIITAHNCATKHLNQQPQSQTNQSAMLSDVGRSRLSTIGPSTPAGEPLFVTLWKLMMNPGSRNWCAALMRVNQSSTIHIYSKPTTRFQGKTSSNDLRR